MDVLGWPLPTCSYCNYSLVLFSSLIQKSHHRDCISHGQGVKATHSYVVAPNKPATAPREQWQGTSARHCQGLDVWPGMWKGKEGRVGLKEQDQDRYLQRKLEIPDYGFVSTAKCRWGCRRSQL